MSKLRCCDCSKLPRLVVICSWLLLVLRRTIGSPSPSTIGSFRKQYRMSGYMLGQSELPTVKKVAVIGAGAAGMIVADVFLKQGLNVTIFEKNSHPGGVWKYKPGTVMYNSLRTNLPKEIMAFSIDTPFSDSLVIKSESGRKQGSYLSHGDIQAYLEDFMEQRDMHRYVRYDTTVMKVLQTQQLQRGKATCGKETLDSVAAIDATNEDDDHQQELELKGGEGTAAAVASSSSAADRSDSQWMVQFQQSQQQQQQQQQQQGQPAVASSSSTSSSSSVQTESFDAVVVCNGHYNTPYFPPQLDGFYEHFRGINYHSSRYDEIKTSLKGKNVLVVGSKSSGTDMARELKEIAKTVYVSDRNYQPPSVIVETNSNEGSQQNSNIGTIEQHDNLYLLPGIETCEKDGKILFRHGQLLGDIDVILWCTGFCYDFPFLPNSHTIVPTSNKKPIESTNKKETKKEEEEGVDNTNNNNNDNNDNNNNNNDHDHDDDNNNNNNNNNTGRFPPIQVENNKRVRPLYLQLVSHNAPTLAFVGLPFSVVPFPLFYFQAEYLAALYTGKISLPGVSDRECWLREFEEAIVQKGMYDEKYHFLGGSLQWEYSRNLARLTGLISEEGYSDSKPHRIARYIDMIESIYNNNGENKPAYTGAEDSYRNRRFTIDWKDLTWTVENV